MRPEPPPSLRRTAWSSRPRALGALPSRIRGTRRRRRPPNRAPVPQRRTRARRVSRTRRTQHAYRLSQIDPKGRPCAHHRPRFSFAQSVLSPAAGIRPCGRCSGARLAGSDLRRPGHGAARSPRRRHGRSAGPAPSGRPRSWRRHRVATRRPQAPSGRTAPRRLAPATGCRGIATHLVGLRIAPRSDRRFAPPRDAGPHVPGRDDVPIVVVHVRFQALVAARTHHGRHTVPPLGRCPVSSPRRLHSAGGEVERARARTPPGALRQVAPARASLRARYRPNEGSEPT